MCNNRCICKEYGDHDTLMYIHDQQSPDRHFADPESFFIKPRIDDWEIDDLYQYLTSDDDIEDHPEIFDEEIPTSLFFERGELIDVEVIDLDE